MCVSIYSSLKGNHEAYGAYSAADETSLLDFVDLAVLFVEIVTHLGVDAIVMLNCVLVVSDGMNEAGEDKVVQGPKEYTTVFHMQVVDVGHPWTSALAF